MGWNASDTRPLTFSDCRVPESNLLGRRGEGFKNFLHILDGGRIGVAAMGVGLAQGALDEAISYAKERRAFGQPISKFQAIQAKIADISAQIEAARLLTYRAAIEKDRGESFTLTAAQAKLITGRLAVRADRGGGPDPRRLRLHRGVPGLPLLPRREDPHDRRGHRRGPADGDRAPARLLKKRLVCAFVTVGTRTRPTEALTLAPELSMYLRGETMGDMESDAKWQQLASLRDELDRPNVVVPICVSRLDGKPHELSPKARGSPRRCRLGRWTRIATRAAGWRPERLGGLALIASPRAAELGAAGVDAIP